MGVVVMPFVLQDKLGDDGAAALIDLLNKVKQGQQENSDQSSQLEALANRLERRIDEEFAKVYRFIVMLMLITTKMN